MIEPAYHHVLFKDLRPYLRKQDYLGGYTSVEQAWIRKNIGAASYEDLKNTLSGAVPVKYDELDSLISRKDLISGTVYLIEEFQTIYQSNELNEEGHYISYGKDINPSKKYTLIAIAISDCQLLSTVSIISDDPDSIFWTAQYDVKKETLDDGITTMGKIVYLSDNNFNQAQFDFKNKLIKQNNKLYHTFSDIDGNDNSLNCFNNNLCQANNIIFIGNCSNNCIYGNDIFFKVPVNNLIGTLNHVQIETDEIGLSNETGKQTVLYDDKYYIDYLDKETLTHQFYALANSIHVTR